jgi:hypothetical protein
MHTNLADLVVIAAQLYATLSLEEALRDMINQLSQMTRALIKR